MIRRILNSRIREINDNILEKARWTAVGHILFSALIAATIAFLTAQTRRISWLEMYPPLWYGTTAVFPIVMAAATSVVWHRFGAPWLSRNTYRGWLLHSFFKPPGQEIRFNLPAPETTLVIASAASASAVIALNGQEPLVQTVSATLIGAVTAAAIVISNPNAGQPLAKGKLDFQEESLYQGLLRRKAQTQRSVLSRQGNQCADCGTNIRDTTRRFAIISEEGLQVGFLTSHDVKAVCKDCARVQATTAEVT